MRKMIHFEDVHKEYDMGKTKVHALKGVTFNVRQGDFLSIVGPSGSGKTTILNLIGCIDDASKGKVFIDSVNAQDMSDKQASQFRNETIGFIFQSFNEVCFIFCFPLQTSTISLQSSGGITPLSSASASPCVPVFDPLGAASWQLSLLLHFFLGIHWLQLVHISVGFILLSPYWQ